MKRLVILLLCGAVSWSGWWFWQAQIVRGASNQWFDTRQSQGWTAEYDAYHLRGFPNRLDQTFENLNLSDPSTGLVWEAPFFQTFQLVYNPSHLILAWPDTQTVKYAGQSLDISSEGLRASVIAPSGKPIERANIEATVLNVKPQGGTALALAGLLAAAQRQDQIGLVYRIALSANAAASGKQQGSSTAIAPQSLQALQGDVTVTLDRPLTVEALTTKRPKLTKIDLQQAEYRYGHLLLKLAGSMDVDDLGRLDGELNLRAENWRDLVKAARDAGHIPETLAETLEQSLGLVAGLSGRKDTLDLPLRLREGAIWLGPIPLGDAPRLILP